MVPETGQIALALALGVALMQGIVPLVGAHRGRVNAMLFADRGMRRGIVELARIVPGQRLYADALQRPGTHAEIIWGRRSVFRITDKPLLVSEIFLPGFPAHSAVRPLWKAGRQDCDRHRSE